MEYKSINKYLNKNQNKKESSNMKKYIKIYISKILICAIMFVSLLIVLKMHPEYKESVYKKVYESNFSFASINKLYKEYFGNILPFEGIVPEEVPVFSEKLVYNDISLYKDGAVLNVANSYLVPVLENGIVVFIGEKEEYGRCIIVQQTDGIDVLYGNVTVGDIKIYDYVEKGKLLGEVLDNKLYMVFQSKGKYLDYKDYI